MKTVKIMAIVFLTIALVAFWITGCGGGGGTPTDSPTSTVSPTPTPTSTISPSPTPTTSPTPTPTITPTPTPTVTPSPSPTVSPTPTWVKDWEVDVSDYGSPRHPLVENDIVNVPIMTYVYRFNATNGNYIDRIDISDATRTVSIDNNDNHIVDLQSVQSMRRYDSNWQNPSSDYPLYKVPKDHSCQPGTNYVSFLSQGGSQNPIIEIIDSITGQRVGSILDIWGLNPDNKYVNPYSIAVYPDGKFAISYYSSHIIGIYDSNGIQIATIGDGSTSGPIAYPWGLAIDDQNRLFISNSADKAQIDVYSSIYSYYTTAAIAEGYNVFDGISVSADGSIIIITDYTGEKIYCYKQQ